MLTFVKKLKNFTQRHKVFSTFLVLFMLGWGVWALINLTPRPLGDQMVYLGKKDHGNIFGFDTYLHRTYYYGTNLDAKGIAKYFSEINASEVVYDTTTSKILVFSDGERDVNIELYNNKSSTGFTTSKKYVIAIDSNNYRYFHKIIR